MTGVRPSEEGDAESLAPRLRAADVAEIEAAGIESPIEALRHGFAHSMQPLTVVVDDEPAAMFGVVRECNHDIGRIWLLGTDGLFSVRVKFARQSRPWLAHVARPFRVVTNYVDMRNEVHVRWLRWCGARFTGIENRGPRGLPFLEFYWRQT